jgi:beta-lactam-binding protein with PASTA domain
MKLSRARTTIRSKRCAVGRITGRRAAKARIGRVIAQSPRAGVVRRVGTRVNLVVGRR